MGLNQTGQKPVSLNLSVGTGDATGTVQVHGFTVRLLRKGGTIYFSANKAFWTSEENEAAAQLFANRWVYGPASSSDFSSFNEFLNPKSITSQFFAQPTTGVTYRKAGTKEVDGQSTVVVTGSQGGKPQGTLYVASTGRPYVVKVSVDGSASGNGAITFTNYGKAVKATAPKGAVSLAELNKS